MAAGMCWLFCHSFGRQMFWVMSAFNGALTLQVVIRDHWPTGPLAHWPTVQPTSRIGFSDVFQFVGFIVRQLDKRILVHCALFSLCVACINMQIVLCENKCIFTLKDTWYFRWSCAVICPSLCDVCRFICTLYSVVFQVCVCARAPPEEFQYFLMLPW